MHVLCSHLGAYVQRGNRELDLSRPVDHNDLALEFLPHGEDLVVLQMFRTMVNLQQSQEMFLQPVPLPIHAEFVPIDVVHGRPLVLLPPGVSALQCVREDHRVLANRCLRPALFEWPSSVLGEKFPADDHPAPPALARESLPELQGVRFVSEGG